MSLQIQARILGKSYGNFYPGLYDGHIGTLARLIRKYADKKIRVAFNPRSDGNKGIAVFRDHHTAGDATIHGWWLISSRTPVDGAVISGTDDAILIFTADSPVVVIRSGRTLVALKCGVWSAMETEEAPSIIKLARRHIHNPKKAEALIAYGIGPCCYGIQKFRDIFGANELPLGIATRGPRKGQDSLDLYELCRRELRKIGIPAKNIRMKYQGGHRRACTACAGRIRNENRPGLFYSEVRDGPQTGASAVLVRIAE